MAFATKCEAPNLAVNLHLEIPIFMRQLNRRQVEQLVRRDTRQLMQANAKHSSVPQQALCYQ